MSPLPLILWSAGGTSDRSAAHPLFTASIRRWAVRSAVFAAALFAFAAPPAVQAQETVRTGLNGSQPWQPAVSDEIELRLEDLLENVRTENPSLRAAYSDVAALESVRRQVSSLPDPMLMGTYQPYPLMTARGPQRSQWRVEQTIPFPGKLGLQGDIADLNADVAAFEAQTYEQDLVVRTKQLYYDLSRIQQQTALVQEFQERLSDFEQIASLQYEVGTGAQQAILKAQVEKNTLAQRLIELDERQTSVVEALSWLTNRPLPDRAVASADLPVVTLPDEARLREVARTLRPEFDALEAAERRAETQIDLGRKQFMPDFGLNATYFDLAASDAMPTATGRDAFAVGITVKLPVQRDRIRAQIEEARARVTSSHSRQEALVTNYSTQIADLANQIRREFEQLALYQDLLLPQAESNVEATLSAYTTGRTDFLNLLDSERMLFQLRMGYEESSSRYLKAIAALERALGLDSLSQLQDPNLLPTPAPGNQ